MREVTDVFNRGEFSMEESDVLSTSNRLMKNDFKRLELIGQLIEILLSEMPEFKSFAQSFGENIAERRLLLRSLMNVRPPLPLNRDFTRLQDRLLGLELVEKGFVDSALLPSIAATERLVLWRGDITRLKVDAIVNAANDAMLGCFIPCHGCIDNAIHSAAGLQLRAECAAIMNRQKKPESPGKAIMTGGYNLPAAYVIHTVGPIVKEMVTAEDVRVLTSCYRSVLELAASKKLDSVALCAVGTGEYRFPPHLAADIAVRTVKEFISRYDRPWRIIFDVFTERDERFYRAILGPDEPSR